MKTPKQSGIGKKQGNFLERVSLNLPLPSPVLRVVPCQDSGLQRQHCKARHPHRAVLHSPVIASLILSQNFIKNIAQVFKDILGGFWGRRGRGTKFERPEICLLIPPQTLGPKAERDGGEDAPGLGCTRETEKMVRRDRPSLPGPQPGYSRVGTVHMAAQLWQSQ